MGPDATRDAALSAEGRDGAEGERGSARGQEDRAEEIDVDPAEVPVDYVPEYRSEGDEGESMRLRS